MNHSTTLTVFLLLLCCSVVNAGDAGMKAELLDRFQAKIYKDDKGGELPYRILVPPGAKPIERGKSDGKGAKFPLILFLHGAGERGNDNKSQLKWGGSMLAQDAQEQHPCFVVAPQCPSGKQWVNTPWAKGSYSTDAVPISDQLRMALEIVKQVQQTYPIDPDRIYVIGLSMGGYGTWDAIAREPDKFAAAVPICGAGDPSKAPQMKSVAVWAFHGGADPTVPTQGSRDMVEALKKAGAKPRYTEYPGVGHDSWSHAFTDPELIDWLFKQKRERH